MMTTTTETALPAFIRLRQAAAQIGVSVSTFRRQRYYYMEPVRLGDRIVAFRRADLQRVLAAGPSGKRPARRRHQQQPPPGETP